MSSFGRKEWKVFEKINGDGGSEFGVSSLVYQLLWNRGIRGAGDIGEFFNFDYDTGVNDSFLFLRMHDVVDRIFLALENGDRIMVHGDYDADGVCGSAVVLEALKMVCDKGGYSAFEDGLIGWNLPDREGDGYGLSIGSVERFGEAGVDVIITVDCGVANTDEIERAYELGMEVIVIDHHQMPEVLSDKAMIIHPLVPGETYPFTKMAAVGVAYKVACGLYIAARERRIGIAIGAEKWLLDLVAIATVTDMVPLIGENRILEHFGLMVLNKTRRLGFLALFDEVGLSLGDINAMDIGFRIGPRINAAGRVAKADAALELLLSDDEGEARRLAENLNALNVERQSLTGKATRTALDSVDSKVNFVAVVDNSIRIGVAGLVAGKLVSETGKPAVVMTEVDGRYVGSGRGPAGFHFIKAMDTCRDLMIGGGGHPAACGFKLEEENIEAWVDAMDKFAGETMDGALPVLNIDMEIGLKDVDWSLVEDIAKMEPFGVGNSVPLFVSSELYVISAERMGKTGAHLRLTVADTDSVIRKCVGFGMGKFADDCVMGDVVSIVYEVNVNEWHGNRDIQLQLTDIEKI